MGVNRIGMVFSQSVACLCELEAMKALNAERADKGLAQAYGEDAFASLPEKYGLGYVDREGLASRLMEIVRSANNASLCAEVIAMECADAAIAYMGARPVFQPSHDVNCDSNQPGPDLGPSQKPCNCKTATMKCGVGEAIDRAVELFGGAGSDQEGVFNMANFSHALMEQAGLRGVVDGYLCRVILADRDDVEQFGPSDAYYRRKPK